MNYYTLKTYHTNQTLFSGQFHNFTECLEQAIKDNINLNHADLRSQNLSNANIDGALMNHAVFDGSNLTGANMSECTIKHSTFKNCSVYNTCLAYSNLQGTDFSGCSFGGTLVEGSNLRDCLFSTLSCFDLEFAITSAMQGCKFIDIKEQKHEMSSPPIILKGFITSPIIILDNTVKIGSLIFTDNILPSLVKMIEHTLHPESLKICKAIG